MATKRITEMEREEILALTDEEIDRLTDYECALAGAPMLPPHPGPKPEEPSDERDAVVYEVGGEAFEDEDEANEVAATINRGHRVDLTYTPGYGYHKRITGRAMDLVRVTKTRAYSAAKWDAVQREHATFNDRRRVWEERSKEYDAATKARAEIVDRVSGIVSDAAQWDADRTRFTSLWHRYLGLADGEPEIARTFLLNAYPEADEFLDAIIGSPAAESEVTS